MVEKWTQVMIVTNYEVHIKPRLNMIIKSKTVFWYNIEAVAEKFLDQKIYDWTLSKDLMM